MAQLQTIDYQSRENLGTGVEASHPLEHSGSFSRASHFFFALIPMWIGIAYLFVEDLLRVAEPGMSVTLDGINQYTSLDSSFAGHLFLWVACYFGIGFGLCVLRVITKVEEKNY